MRDVQIQIDPSSSVPAYRQIVEQFRHYLVEGTLNPGDRLPGVRSLAMDLGVHFNTVAEAYRTLSEEGWLEVSQGRPVIVRERSQPPPVSERIEQGFRQRMSMLIAEMRASGLSVESIARELRAVEQRIKP
jgi:GntR family transcriptional regulator